MSPSSLLLFRGPALAQSGFSAFLQQLCSSPSAVWSLQMWETESSPLNLPDSVRKPKAQHVRIFRVSLLLMRNLQDPRASIASHVCKCLFTTSKKTQESQRVEGFWRLALPNFLLPTHPLSDITEKKPRTWTWQAMGLRGIKGWSLLQNIHTAASQFFLLFPPWLLKIPLLMQSRAGVLWPPYERNNL